MHNINDDDDKYTNLRCSNVTFVHNEQPIIGREVVGEAVGGLAGSTSVQEEKSMYYTVKQGQRRGGTSGRRNSLLHDAHG